MSGIRNKPSRATVRHPCGQILRPNGCVERHRGATCGEDAVIGGNVFGGVLHEHGDSIARLYSFALEEAGECFDVRPEFPI